ncbi:hypothetical protein LINPERPRIM_LOCUS4073 [Linum perenne]
MTITIGESELQKQQHIIIWTVLAQLSFNLSIFLFKLPSRSRPFFMIAWILLMTLTHPVRHSNPLTKRRRIGRPNKTALEVACLLAAAATRYNYDPYKLLYVETTWPYYMYYYDVVVLSTYLVYTHLKALGVASDLRFGDLWSVILMESFVYWMPTEMMVVSTLAVCFATIGCRYGELESVIPDMVARWLGFGLVVVTIAWPVSVVGQTYKEGTMEADEKRGRLFGLNSKQLELLKHSLMTNFVMYWTLIAQWVENNVNVLGFMMKKKEQANPNPIRTQENVLPEAKTQHQINKGTKEE